MQPGALLRDRYKVEAEVRPGLYRVFDERYHTCWALWELDASRAPAGAAEAFAREADFFAHLRHQGLAQVVDHFVEGPRAYVVTEWVDGAPVGERSAIPLEQVVDLGAQLLDVIYFLHTGDRPVAFRVVSPATVWVTGDDEVKLVGYGLGDHFDPTRAQTAADRTDLAADTRAVAVVLRGMAGDAIPAALRQVLDHADAPGYADVGTFKHDLMAVAEGFAPDSTPSAGALVSTAEARPQAASTRKGCGAGAAVALLLGLLAWLVACLHVLD